MAHRGVGTTQKILAYCVYAAFFCVVPPCAASLDRDFEQVLRELQRAKYFYLAVMMHWVLELHTSMQRRSVAASEIVRMTTITRI